MVIIVLIGTFNKERYILKGVHLNAKNLTNFLQNYFYDIKIFPIKINESKSV